MNNLPYTLTEAQWEEIKASYFHSCVYCNRQDVPLQREHIVPVTKGGGYTPDNIVPACASCNSSKGNKNLIVWMGTRI